MTKYNGFTFTETLIAFSIVVMLAFTMLPIITIIKKERSNLDLRLTVANLLHDDLQDHIFIKEHSVTNTYTRHVQNRTITFSFEGDDMYIEGCAIWTNERQTQEDICLYGHVQQ